MKKTFSFAIIAAACFTFGSSSEAQNVEFEFTPDAALNGGFSTPSFITFDSTSGSFNLVGAPANVVSYDFTTPDGELDSGNSSFGQDGLPVSQSATWSSAAILDLNLTVNTTFFPLGPDAPFTEYTENDIGLTSIAYNSVVLFEGTFPVFGDNGTLTGTWAAVSGAHTVPVPDVTNSLTLLALAVLGLFGVQNLRRPRLQAAV